MSAVVGPLAPGIRRLLPPATAAQQAADTAHAAIGTDDAGLAASALFRVARLLATGATGLALVALLVCSWFVRYTSHAFQMADLLRQSGFIGGQMVWYQGWTGRFGANATWLAAAAAGPVMARLLPTLYVAAAGAVLWVTMPRVAAMTGRRLGGVSQLLAVEVVLLATLVGAPALWFDLYKLTGSITYVTPLMLGTAALAVGIGAVASGRLGTATAVGLFALCALSMGFSDTYSGVAPVIIAILGLCAAFVARKPLRTVALRAALVAATGSAIGLVVMLRAPGNSVRRSLYPAPPHFTTAVSRAIRDGWQFLTGAPARSGLALLGVAVAFLVLGMVAAPPQHRSARRPGLTLRRALLAVLGLLAVVAVAHLPAEQMTSAPPPPRSEIVPTYATVLAIAFLAWSAGVSLALRRPRLAARSTRRLSLIVATAAVAVVPALTMAMVARSWVAMSTYAAAEDRQWQQAANAAPGADVVVDPVPSTGIGPLSHDPMQELQPDPAYWVNKAYAEYFGLRSVRVAGGDASLVR
jgi:hypothetical protein